MKITMKFATIVSLTATMMFSAGMLHAQSTPEAIIGQTPDLPSLAHLVAADDDAAASAAIEAFHSRIAELEERIEEAVERVSAGIEEAGRADAERIAEQMTGRSIAELENMSDAELQAMAEQMTQGQLTAAGFGGMSLDDLQALEGKSEEEIMAAMTGGGMRVGGLTMSELESMDGMSDAEMAAYMQQGDRMQRMQEAAPSKEQQRDADTKTRNAMAQADIATEMRIITDRWQEIDRLNNADMQAVSEQCAEIAEKYRPEMSMIAGRYFDGKVDATPEEIEAAGVRFNALRHAMSMESYTIWRSVLPKLQGRVKTKMADVARYDELFRQSMAGGGMTAASTKLPSVGFEIARDYLDLTASITSLP